MTVLEVGCGSGNSIARVVERGGQLVYSIFTVLIGLLLARPEQVLLSRPPGSQSGGFSFRSAAAATRLSVRSCDSSWTTERQGSIREFRRSSGGLDGSPSDQPPQPTNGSSGRLWSQARHTSEIVPARPPITMQASPANAIIRFRASPMPHGITTVAGQSGEGISSDGTMLTTNPPAFAACSAAILVAALPHPLMTVMPSRAKRAPASPAN